MSSAPISRQGLWLAIAAYTMWGFVPIYFKAVGSIPAEEVLSHRIIWSCVLLLGLLPFAKGWNRLRPHLKNSRTLAWLMLSSILVGGNWFIFIWAINNEHILDASLGYYINPLLNIVLGMIFMGERFRTIQWLAISLAALGVGLEVIRFGAVPWVALLLAFTFGFYALIRKRLLVDARSGLLLETTLLLPAAAIYMLFFASPETGFSQNPVYLNVLLALAGVVTTLPLLCFASAAQRLPLSTLGFLQYIGPSLMFLLAILLYGETLNPEKLTTFCLIWLALAIYSLDGWSHHRQHVSSASG